jgi:hypothetical protein
MVRRLHACGRRARAVVDVLCISPCEKEDDGEYHRYRDSQMVDPFDAWFQETFPEVKTIDAVTDEATKERINGDLLKGYNLVDRLVELYQADMAKMHASYRALCQIDPVLLKTVGVEAAQVKEGLKAKIKGLKNLYWQELFDHLDKVTVRLTSGSRKSIVEKMASAVHVDFTSDNAYAVVLWVLKNANLYIESQLTDLFRELSGPENVRNYKSNHKTWDHERWRYIQHSSWNHGKQETPTRYMLEYRIIVMKYNAIGGDGSSCSWDYKNGLHKDCHAFLQDIMTVANNLGFPCSYICWQWSSGSPQEFYLDNGETLMRVRAFMNGNLHIQFNQDFIKVLNVEASRLLGWIRSPREVVEEMDIDWTTAQQCFNSNKVFAASEYKLLTA